MCRLEPGGGYTFDLNVKGAPEEVTDRLLAEAGPPDDYDIEGEFEVLMYPDLESQFEGSVQVTFLDGVRIGWIRKGDQDIANAILDGLNAARPRKTRSVPFRCQVTLCVTGEKDEEDGELYLGGAYVDIDHPPAAERIA